MHLTTVRLTPMVRSAMLENREHGHKHVLSAFGRVDGGSPRAAFKVLWTVDPESRQLIVQSRDRPLNPHVLGEVLDSHEVIPPAQHSELTVRLTLACQKTPVSPVPPELRDTIKQGKAYRSRLVIVPEKDRPEWAVNRLAKIGFQVDPRTLQVSALERASLGTRGRSIPSITVAAHGHVNDPGAFAHALESGIGKAKNYGLGLLQFHRLTAE